MSSPSVPSLARSTDWPVYVVKGALPSMHPVSAGYGTQDFAHSRPVTFFFFFFFFVVTGLFQVSVWFCQAPNVVQKPLQKR